MAMRKIWLALTAALLAAAIVLTGCASGGKDKAEKMDFNAEITLKAPDPAPGEMPKILFVGNSHTFYNDLPGTFLEVAYALGHDSDVYELSEGYYTLENYADPEDELGAVLDEALTKESWDFVILQENTSKAVSPSADQEMFPFARALDEKIKDAGGQTAFLMTWSPKNGVDSGLIKMDRDQVQTMLAENYMAIADELDSLLVPAGIAFIRAAGQYADLELWDEDGQHPSPAGTYLAACTAYAVIFQESPENCSYVGELDVDTASKLQKIAAELVLN